ncbi:MAG: hypothetical protein QY312_03235 [Candidatus Dojkabacteria bacterium]|nr:MAG: hypothetical protein QY312_03235 [Candidatus Dojkabacteria bacterium]
MEKISNVIAAPQLSDYFVSHAEIEYLYDGEGENSGAIDPNALSAGGGPFIFRMILRFVDTSRAVASEIPNRLQQTLKQVLPSMGNQAIQELNSQIVSHLERMGINSLESFEYLEKKIIEKMPDILELYNNTALIQRLNGLFETEYGIVWFAPKLWREYKLRQIELFLKAVRQGKQIGPFAADFNKNMKAYLDTLCQTLEPIPPEYVTFDVEWETDFSYYVAYKKSQEGVIIRVLMDLHSNSGLFAEIPLQAILAPYGKKRYNDVYGLLLESDAGVQERNGFRYTNHKCKIIIEEGGRKELCFSSGIMIKLADSVTTTREAIQGDFKQYAYLWEWFDKSKFDYSRDSHRKMYLSSFLNAKSGFFEIFKYAQEKYGISLKYPKTNVFGKKSIPNMDGYSEFVNIKDGGWCSTGGKHVHLVKKEHLKRDVEKLHYPGYLVQIHIPSLLFIHEDGTKYHGHARKVSIVNRSGDIVHLGFFLRMVEESKGNSSGYRAYRMVFNDEGNFIVSYRTGGEPQTYLSLEETKLKPLVSDLKAFLIEVKQEWHKQIYALNKFVAEEDVPAFVAQLVKDGKLSKRYLIS